MKKKATTKREAILADVGKTPEEHANELMEYQYRFEEEMKPIRDELYNAAHLFIVPDARLSTNGELEDIRRAHSMSRDNVVHGLRAFAHEQVLSYGRTRKASPIDDPLGEDITLAENAFKEHMITIANRFPDVSNRAVEISAEIGRFIQECYFNTDKNNQGPARDLEDIICKTNALFDALATPEKNKKKYNYPKKPHELRVLKLGGHLWKPEVYKSPVPKSIVDDIRANSKDEGIAQCEDTSAHRAILTLVNHREYAKIICEKGDGSTGSAVKNIHSWCTYLANWDLDNRHSK